MEAIFENDHVKLAVGADGRALHFIDRQTGKDYCKPGTPFARIAVGGREFAATAASREGDFLKLAFGASGVRATLRIANARDYFIAQIDSVAGGEIDSFVIVDLPLTLRGSMDEPFAGCALALDLRSRIDAWPGPCSRLLATAYRRFGFVGARVAIIGCPPSKMRGILQKAVSAAPDMPHSALGGPWAMDADCARGSYLFNFDGITVANADAWIELAKSLGVTQIDFHGGSSFRFGDCRPNPTTYPNGIKDLKAAIDKLHAAGIRAGLHTYAMMIAQDCPWVTPVPDPRLACDRVLTLAAPIGEADTTVAVDESTADMSIDTGFFVRNSVTVRIENELITYTGISKQPPYSFTGCTRGALGTKASSHAKGAKVHHLLQCFGLFAPDGESTLLAEVAQKTADTFNQCGFDNIYLDALDAEDVLGGPQWGWHYGSKFVWDVCKKLHKPALMEMSTFHHHLWCVRSRMGAWDHPSRGHKQFIDNHCAANENNKRIFLPSQLGWWTIKPWGGAQVEPTYPDVMEYLLCKALGTDTGYALMGINPTTYRADPFARRLAEISKRYEELRLSGTVPESVKAQLRQPGKEFTLDGNLHSKWQFRPIRYDRHKAVGETSDSWVAENQFGKQPVRLRIEALLSAGPYEDPANVVLADFANTSAFAVSHTPPDIAAQLTSSTEQSKTSSASGYFTATNNRKTREGAWTMLEKTFTPPLNLSAQQGMGVWVYGDGQGEVLNIQVRSPRHISDAMAEHYIDVDFSGWRYFELIEPEGERFAHYRWPYDRPELTWDKEVEGSDNAPQHWIAGQYGIYRESVSYDHISTLSLWYNNLPVGKTVKTYLSPIKALPLKTAKLKGPSVTIDGKTITFPVELESGSYIEFNSPADCKLYDAKGALVSEVTPVGDVPVLMPGRNKIAFRTSADDATPRAFVSVISQGEPLK